VTYSGPAAVSQHFQLSSPVLSKVKSAARQAQVIVSRHAAQLVWIAVGWQRSSVGPLDVTACSRVRQVSPALQGLFWFC